MIPRREVGLVFTSIELTLSLQGEQVVARSPSPAVVVMGVVTAMITPPALKGRLGRGRR
jgi:hypothetical protein